MTIQNPPPTSPNGIIFIDKPASFTSHDVVAKTRRAFGIKKVGHAGTLDPMATGLLTLGLGPSTRLLTYMVGLDKTYRATVRLGASTVSDDSEGEVLAVASSEQVAAVSDDQIRREVAKLTGEIVQVPSAVSAIKIRGRRAYDLVRDGQVVELKGRQVMIYAFDFNNITRIRASISNPNPEDAPAATNSTGDTLRHYDAIDVEVIVHCSSGTYIRALARDLGAALGVHGHLTSLRRTSVGPFALADHESPSTPESRAPFDRVAVQQTDVLTSPASVARELFSVLELSHDESVWLLQGKRFTVDHPDTPLVAALNPEGDLLGLLEVKNQKIRSLTNFPQS